jgi:hypothetical protein
VAEWFSDSALTLRLRVCFHSKVSLLSFLLETIPTVNTANTSTESNKSNVSSNKKRPPGRKLDLKETEEVLKWMSAQVLEVGDEECC